MLKIIADAWAKNNGKLRDALKTTDMDAIGYKKLVEMAFSYVYNNSDSVVTGKTCPADVHNITLIDNGDYQGTLLFIIPFDTYQPTCGEYLLTYADYGSCSGCDTLMAITEYESGSPSEEQLNDLMMLCLDILEHVVKPYNSGWRYEEDFEEVT